MNQHGHFTMRRHPPAGRHFSGQDAAGAYCNVPPRGLAAAFAAVAVVLATVPATAQLVNASASSLALSGNDTATARAFGAISVNPAGLAMPESDFSLALFPVRAYVGVAPITLADWKQHEGKLVPHATKTQWMKNIDSAAGQRLAAGVDLSEVALTFWHLGFQLSTVVAVDGRLPPDVVEAVLFGNTGRECPRERTGCTPRPKTLSVANGSADLAATTTAGLSFAAPLAEWMRNDFTQAFDQLSLGATVTFTLGHAMAVANTSGSIPHDKPEAEFGASVVHTRIVTDNAFSHYLNGGYGLGLDLGVMFSLAALSDLTVGVSVQNVFNTFEWDTSKLVSRNFAGSIDIDNGEISLDFDLSDITGGDSYAKADSKIKKQVRELRFKPTVRVGGAYDILDDLTLSGDVHYRFGRGIALAPQFHTGVGVEYRVLAPLHLRAGLAYLTDEFRVHLFQFSGGLSAILGPVNLSTAIAVQHTGPLLAQFVLSFGYR